MNRTKHLLTHRCPLLHHPAGRISSLLDMGGVPQAATNTRINVGKNNKVRAVALDFHLITRSIEQRRRQVELSGVVDKKPGVSTDKPLKTDVKPDVSMVEKMASLLNVKLGDASPRKNSSRDDETEDDLASVLMGNKKDKKQPRQSSKQMPTQSSGPNLDIRSKYASKLRNKIEGGVAGIDLMNYERGELLKRGDASSLFTAKSIISNNESTNANPSSSRWLATTGVGQLLSYLTMRSMQIILLPVPSTHDNPQSDQDTQRNSEEMTSLTKQLPHVQFDLCIPNGRRRDEECPHDNAAQDILQHVTSQIDIPPLSYAVVSDRDDYLREARERGMFTIRVRPKNTRRGDVTASYSVEDVGGVEEVINQINGISFNSALKR